jgi:predicted NBD/HSP70 family sugar kinase
MLEPHGNVELREFRPAGRDVSREITRSLLLNLIRTRQPLSRADLMRASGLSRSTVSLIVQQLIEEHWVTEGPTGRLPLGRPPTFLKLNDERTIVGVDLSPAEAIVALSDLTGHFGVRESIEMPSDRTAAVAQLIARIRRILDRASGKTIEGIGICLQGDPCLPSSCTVRRPKRYWLDVDVGARIAEATGLAVEVDSAANACALANVWFDNTAGAPASSKVVIAVAAEIQTVTLTNGQLLRGRNGVAGDYGHVQLDPNGPICECGGRGCWTVFASNRAALRYYAGPDNQSPGITFLDLLSLVDRGDVYAAKAVAAMANWLGLGFRMIAASIAPDSILVVGDVTRSWDRLMPSIMAGLTTQPLALEQIPCIVPVRDGAAARLCGAVALVLQRRFAAWDSGRP